MGSSHKMDAPADASAEVSASERGAVDHQTSPGSVGSPSAWAMGTPPPASGAGSARAHDHVQFVIMQSQSTMGSPTAGGGGGGGGGRPHFVPVTSAAITNDQLDHAYHEAVSPSSAPGDSRHRDSPDASGFLRSFSQPDPNRRYAASSPGGRLSHLGGAGRNSTGLKFVSERNVSRDAAHELARQALSHRKISIGDVTFDNPRDSNLRESVRRVHAHSRREAPLDYELSASVKWKSRVCQLTMDRDVLEWKRSATRVAGRIDTDDIVAAHALSTGKIASADPSKPPEYAQLAFRVHYFVKGSKRNNEKALKRKHHYVDFLCENGETAYRWVHTIQELVRWQARAPPIAEKRKIKIVVNPHSGRRRAVRIWHEQVKQFFEWGNFECVVEETAYSGHAIDMGRQFSADDGFEAMVFIGGDGTLCEFMNGLLSRPEHEWREIVATTPLSLISAGTQNAFGKGVGIPTIAAAVYCIIKRKIRPLDVITASAENEPGKVHYSYCGVGWGIPGDIAAQSEKYRWMGVLRYAFLKVKYAVVMPKRHSGRIRYVPTDPQPVLRKYFDIRDEGALDQFEMEEGNVYDSFLEPVANGAAGSTSFSQVRKSWGGFGGAVRSPASSKRYPESAWVNEQGQFMVVGAVNAAPDGAYSHPSDGNLDLIISRKGSFGALIRFGLLYLVGRELESPLISYKKVKALVVEQDADQAGNCMNIDGEVLPGPGPWRMEVVPSLFKALSEK